MAAPVTNKIIPGAGPACDTVFQISFFIPFEFQDNPPLPTNDTVFIADDPELTVRSPACADLTSLFREQFINLVALPTNGTKCYHPLKICMMLSLVTDNMISTQTSIMFVDMTVVMTLSPLPVPILVACISVCACVCV